MQSSDARMRFESFIDSVKEDLKNERVSSVDYLKDKIQGLKNLENEGEYRVSLTQLLILLSQPVISRGMLADKVIPAVLPTLIRTMEQLFDIASEIKTHAHIDAFFCFKIYLDPTVFNTRTQISALVMIAQREHLSSRQENVIQCIRENILSEASQEQYREIRGTLEKIQETVVASLLTDSTSSATYSNIKKRKLYNEEQEKQPSPGSSV